MNMVASVICHTIRKSLLNFKDHFVFHNTAVYLTYSFHVSEMKKSRSHVPGMLASCSVDKTVTLWDTYNTSENATCGPPQACGNKDMNVGKLYTVNFYPSTPWLLGCAGGGKELALWDMTREAPVQNRFGGRVSATTTTESADETEQKEAFDEMMASTNHEAPTEIKASKSPSKKKKLGNKKKKKVHRAGR